MPSSTDEPSGGSGVTQGQPNGDGEATRKVNGSHKSETSHEPELTPGTEDAQESSSKLAPALTPAPSEPTEKREGNGTGKGHQNGGTGNNEADANSELSDPSSPNSPLNLGDEIVVSDRATGDQPSSARAQDETEDEDETMRDAPAQERPVVSPYPKRKRTSTFSRGDDEAYSESPATKVEPNAHPIGRTKLQIGKPRPAQSANKGVILGHWRESPVPDQHRKHAVIGFIDIRDRLRTRIQGTNLLGEQVSNIWPLASKTGASWVTFEGIYFLPHLVGLDQLQVKEYVRLRLDAHEETEEARVAAEKAAVEKAIKKVREAALLADSSSANHPQPHIAYGAEIPDSAKRRRTSAGYTAGGNSSYGESANERSTLDPLPGTRPTRVLLGVWAKSNVSTREGRHAVYGILGLNDMFRVKLVRETRTGHYVDANFPQGAGALWISYEDVDFDDHLKNLTRAEIKEYCRVRQYQIDKGEDEDERIGNETRAVYEAQRRAAAGTGTAPKQPNFSPGYATADSEDPQIPDIAASRTGFGGQELRSSRRVEAMARQQQQQQQQQQQSPQERARTLHTRQSAHENDQQSLGVLQRTSALAQREIARVEAAQGRADLHATQRERAAVAAAQATDQAAATAAAATPSTSVNAESRFHASDEVQRLNNVWARQESMRARASGEDAKIYDGTKYERKTTGPFIGKLVSHGTIINIDGEDYVEYRVLTKPSFF